MPRVRLGTYKKQVSELLPYGIYTIPEVSCVGLCEEDALVRGHQFVVGRALYRDNARGKIIGDKDGLVKLVFDRAIAQAHRLPLHRRSRDRARPHRPVVILLGGTVDTFIEMVFNYPTLSECFKYAAYDALAKFYRAERALPVVGAVLVLPRGPPHCVRGAVRVTAGAVRVTGRSVGERCVN